MSLPIYVCIPCGTVFATNKPLDEPPLCSVCRQPMVEDEDREEDTDDEE
jgi:hypothetical protein